MLYIILFVICVKLFIIYYILFLYIYIYSLKLLYVSSIWILVNVYAMCNIFIYVSMYVHAHIACNAAVLCICKYYTIIQYTGQTESSCGTVFFDFNHCTQWHRLMIPHDRQIFRWFKLPTSFKQQVPNVPDQTVH